MTVHPIALAAVPDEIPAAGELLNHLDTAIRELGAAADALTRLHTHPRCSAGLLDGRNGSDIRTFIDDATRLSRAAYALLAVTIDHDGAPQ